MGCLYRTVHIATIGFGSLSSTQKQLSFHKRSIENRVAVVLMGKQKSILGRLDVFVVPDFIGVAEEFCRYLPIVLYKLLDDPLLSLLETKMRCAAVQESFECKL